MTRDEKLEQRIRARRQRDWKYGAIICNSFDSDIARLQWKCICENFYNYRSVPEHQEKMDKATDEVMGMLRREGFTLYDAQMLIVSLGQRLVRLTLDDPMRKISQFEDSGYMPELPSNSEKD